MLCMGEKKKARLNDWSCSWNTNIQIGKFHGDSFSQCVIGTVLVGELLVKPSYFRPTRKHGRFEDTELGKI